jgi:diketogulonate reductase-like aldo/keto reductase
MLAALLTSLRTCNGDSRSIISIEDSLRQLGCAIVERVQVHWCFPRKDFSDGLVPDENDAEMISMIAAVKKHEIHLC